VGNWSFPCKKGNREKKTKVRPGSHHRSKREAGGTQGRRLFGGNEMPQNKAPVGKKKSASSREKWVAKGGVTPY